MWMPGLLGLWTMLSKKIELIVTDSSFEKIIMLTVVLNTTLLAFVRLKTLALIDIQVDRISNHMI